LLRGPQVADADHVNAQFLVFRHVAFLAFSIRFASRAA
jgi:hypothetical protein